MLVKICNLDLKNRIANVCKASHRDNYSKDKGEFLIEWNNKNKKLNISPVIGRTYSIIPKIKWVTKKGSSILLHGRLTDFTSIEDRGRYKI